MPETGTLAGIVQYVRTSGRGLILIVMIIKDNNVAENTHTFRIRVRPLTAPQCKPSQILGNNIISQSTRRGPSPAAFTLTEHQEP